jgi:hypothetical protein
MRTELTAITLPLNWVFGILFLGVFMYFWLFDIVLLVLAFHPAHLNLLVEVVLPY